MQKTHYADQAVFRPLPVLTEYLFALSLRLLRYAEGPDGRADEASSRETDEEKKARQWHALYAAACAVEQAERLIV
jgi:hypothetical protein